MSMKKKIKVALMVTGIVGSIVNMANFTTVSAEESTIPVNLSTEPLILDVTVPTAFSFNVTNKGEVVKSTENKIINNSGGAIRVDDIRIEGNNSWKIVDYDKDFSGVSVGTKELGFKLNEFKTKGSKLEYNEKIKLDGIGGNSQLDLEYDGKFPMQIEELKDNKIANVVFDIGWFK